VLVFCLGLDLVGLQFTLQLLHAVGNLHFDLFAICLLLLDVVVSRSFVAVDLDLLYQPFFLVSSLSFFFLLVPRKLFLLLQIF